ncbi:YadA-like family protein [uncultured Aggregatibacter sp.]|uniref:YadA-like family protein n=1 Tax=uncultured Aggregatibacter sp. TaxID=470564 RepID=UPI001A58ED0D|nr:YadA-like family protein [uncultured Aggregatibacter sp.]VTX69468.1 Adhesin Ata autotransporter [uncultured Aggregatibacter sp.]
MNHIYKSIFNKALGVFTAVPEFASAHGKGSERTVVGRVAKGTSGFAASALAISVGLALTSTSAVGYPGIYINDRQAGNCLAINDSAIPNLGVGTILDVNSTPGSVVLKVPGTSTAPAGITPSYYNAAGSARPCTAVGGSVVDNRETQTNRTLFYGGAGAATEADEVNNENNGAKNLTLGGRLDVNSGIIGVGDRGVNGLDATNSIRMGMGTALSDDNKKTDAVTIGVNAGASAKHATAIGSATTAKTGYSTALGYQAQAGDPAVTLLNGEYATAIGGQAKALHAQATAVGAESVASGVGQTSIGAYAGKNGTGDQVRQSYGIFIGRFAGSDNQNPNAATEGGNNYGVSIGESAGRYGQGGTRNTAIGEQAGQYLKGSHNIAMGTNAGSGSATDKLEVSNTTAIGNAAKALTTNSISIGLNSKSGKADAFSGENSIAIGSIAEAMGTSSIAMGSHASTSNGHDSIALGTYATTENQKATAIGSYSAATGRQSLTIANNYDSKNLKPVSVASGARATVIGAETTVSGDNSVAIGDTNTVASARTYALGNNINAAAGTDDSLVFGTRAAVSARDTIAMGNTAQAKTRHSIAIGQDSSAGDDSANAEQKGVSAVAIGHGAKANYYDAIAIGARATVAPAAGNTTAADSIAIGVEATADNYKTTAIGTYARAKGRQSTVIANNVQGSNYSTASGDRSQVYGVETTVSGNNSVAIGDTNNVASARTYAIGNNINLAAGTGDSLVFGTQAHTGASHAVAMGKNATVQAQSGVAIGDNAVTNGINQVSIGYKAGDVTETDNKKTPRTTDIGNFGVMIGNYAGAQYTADQNTPVKHQHGTVAVGTQAGRAGKDSWSNIALGNQAGRAVHGNDNIAIGVNSGSGKMTDKFDSDGKDVSTVDEYLNVQHTLSMGTLSTVKNNFNIAIGTTANAGNGEKNPDGSTKNGYSVAIGTSANASALSSMALGAGASASHEYSVALGRLSQTSDVHTGAYTLNGSYTAAGLPKAANGTVSVGSAGKERQIQNVAAGVISATSTDAINGSQLYATNNYLSNLATGVQNVLGGDAAVDNSGNLTMSNIGGTGKGNVNDAIAAANTKVAAGENITVTPTTNADGSKTYTVATTKDLVVNSVKAGDTTVNTDGLTIAGGPSVKKDGINAGDKKITGVADGNVAAGSKEAVNGGQLAEVKAKADSAVQDVVSSNPTALTANKVGNTVTLTPNFIAGDLVNADGTVNDPAAADEGKLVSAKTVADALKANHFVVDTKANGGTVDAASEENAKVGSGNKVTFEAGKNLVAQQTNTANGGATVNYKLSDTLENLVSVKSAEIEAGIGPNKVVLNNNGVKVGDSTLNDKGLTINNGPSVTDAGINAGNKKITDVAPGAVTPTSKDAVNGSQLYNVADNVKDLIGPDATIDPATGKVTVADPTQGIAGTGKGTIGEAIKSVKDKADTAVQDIKSGDEKALSVTKAGNTYTITPNLSGDLVDANGNITAPTTPADKGKLVTAGTVAEALANTHFVVDTKATDGELDAASQADQKIKASNKVTLQAGKNLKAKQTNGANGAEVEFSLKDSISLTQVTAGDSTLNTDGLTIAGGPSVKKDGIDAGDKKITNVAPGAVTAASKDAVNGSQLYNVADNVKDLIGPDAAIDPATGKVTVADPAKGIGETGKGNIGDAIKHVNDAAKAAAETAAKHTTVVEGKNVKVTKGKNAAGGDEYTVATKDDLDVTSVTAGNTTVNTNGLTITGGPSVTRGGIDAGNRVISGVKAGDVSATSQEAVNGSQLHATNTKLDGVKAKADTAVQDVKSGDENALTAVKDPNTNIVTVTPKLSGDLVDADGNITAPATPADKGKLVTAGTVAQALANTHFVVDTAKTDGELDTASEHDQKIKASNKVTLQAGKNLKAKQTNGANGAQVEFSLKDSISLTQVTAGTGDNQVVLGNNGVQVGGNTYINKDGLNANGNKITNVADGVDPKDAVNKGQLDAVKGVADSAVKSVKAKDGEENLVVDNTDPKNPKLSLKKDLTVDSVKAGDSTLNTDGLTIAGGPSVKKDGINAGDKTITNVAPGAVTPTSKDAVNGSQLYNVANNVKDLIGPDATIDPATGKVTVADPAKGIGETGKGNIGDAIKHVNDAAKAAADTAKKHTTVEQGDNIVVEESLNADGGKHYKVSTARDLNVDSVKAGDTTVNNDGVTIAGGPSVTKGGINAGGNTITNVADGVNPNDAVNKGQLDKVAGVADSAVKSVKAADGEQNLVVDNTDPKNPKLSLKKDLTVDSVKAGDSTLNNDGLTIAGGPSVKKDGIDAADKKITNVAAGDVAENSKDAVNGGQLHNVAKGVADVLGGDAAVDGNGKVTMTNIGETGKGNVNDAIKHVNDLAKNAADTAKKHTTVEQGDNIVVEESTNADGGKHYKVSTAKNLNVDSVKAGDTTVNNDGVTINNGPSMTKDGINANNTKVTNVADGVDAADAVNKGQLDKVDTKVSNVAQNVVNVLGGDATVNGNGDITMSNIGETGKGNINDAIKSVNDLAKKAAAEKTSVKAKEGRSNVTVTEGVNAAGGHEYTVDVERSVTNAGSDYVTVTNNHDADTNTTTYTVDVSAKTKASLAKADSAVQGLTSKDGNLNFTKGANGNVEVSFNDNLNVKNVTTDRVQVANGPSMSKDGINAAGKAISNVANGNVAADSKDAVNGGQLHETAKSVADVIGGGATVKDGKVVAGQNGIGNTGQNTVHGAIAAINQNTANNFNQIRGDLRKMDRDLRGGIAGALATAGLPQAFRPGKSMVAAAASTYRGQSGLAIGVSRISDNGKIILKVTGNTNSRGDFGGTIGAGYQW